MKKLHIPLIVLAALLVAVGYFFLCISAAPPTLYINETAVARCGPSAWNWSLYSLVDPANLDYGLENTVAVIPGDTLALRTKQRWWEPRWRIIQGSGSAVFHDEFESVSAQWTGEDTLPVPAVWGESIAELWVSYDGWLRPLVGPNRVRYTFVVNVVSCKH